MVATKRSRSHFLAQDKTCFFVEHASGRTRCDEWKFFQFSAVHAAKFHQAFLHVVMGNQCQIFACIGVVFCGFLLFTCACDGSKVFSEFQGKWLVFVEKVFEVVN
ncbi:hypothetical protein OA162_03950 [Synechococcus sp. AH-736-A19]|nr:hypothetical protein [Synechococcus sp. AH-736-A19]